MQRADEQRASGRDLSDGSSADEDRRTDENPRVGCSADEYADGAPRALRKALLRGREVPRGRLRPLFLNWSADGIDQRRELETNFNVGK